MRTDEVEKSYHLHYAGTTWKVSDYGNALDTPGDDDEDVDDEGYNPSHDRSTTQGGTHAEGLALETCVIHSHEEGDDEEAPRDEKRMMGVEEEGKGGDYIHQENEACQ